MSKAPAFQFYASDFIGDMNVQAMDYDERGVYITLLCHAWTEGSISADPKKLAKLLRLSTARFKRIWEALEPCWEERDGVLVQPRMERVRAEQAAFRDRCSVAGKASAAKRRGLRAVNAGSTTVATLVGFWLAFGCHVGCPPVGVWYQPKSNTPTPTPTPDLRTPPPNQQQLLCVLRDPGSGGRVGGGGATLTMSPEAAS